MIDRYGKPIPGLYATGEVTGGIYGTNCVGGNAVAEIFTIGRIAGENATKGLKLKRNQHSQLGKREI